MREDVVKLMMIECGVNLLLKARTPRLNRKVHKIIIIIGNGVLLIKINIFFQFISHKNTFNALKDFHCCR